MYGRMNFQQSRFIFAFFVASDRASAHIRRKINAGRELQTWIYLRMDPGGSWRGLTSPNRRSRSFLTTE